LQIRDNCNNFVTYLRGIAYDQTQFSFAKMVVWDNSQGSLAWNDLQVAAAEYVVRRMSRAGLKKDFAWSERLRGGIPGDVNGWNNAVNSLPQHAARLQGVDIRCQSVFNLLYDLRTGKDPVSFLVMIDPPFLPLTRVTRKAYGEFDWDNHEHEFFCKQVVDHPSKLLVLGYKNELYADTLEAAGWHRFDREVANNSGQTKTKQKRTVSLWRNF
jgi:site-specific DNA-adenine methylase